ncbi:preprotein translocase subunit SecE [Bryobacter aggregatus]|uniref:preprotein translocase subunit SecE n=1 Tax=Bryobacter aggregatus TaxID=360054 RepID=UPI0004E26708|nr:preprotein translocase subunit SecE [Bryobacter aggregatus]
MATENAMEKASSWPQNVKDYFEDLQKEMRLVTWPSRKQVIATTTVVVASVFLFAAYFAVIDQLFVRAVSQVFKMSAK